MSQSLAAWMAICPVWITCFYVQHQECPTQPQLKLELQSNQLEHPPPHYGISRQPKKLILVGNLILTQLEEL